MKRIGLCVFLLTACALVAQSQPPSSTARVSFEQRWPAADPQWFELVVESDGAAKYRSLPRQDSKSATNDPAPEPYEFSFTLSLQSRQFVFAGASQLPHYQGSLDKVKVAFTGTKTLRYEGGAGTPSTISYNYSSSPELTRLTTFLQGLSETIEFSQTLQFQLRFDKLALDSSLRRAEELVSANQLSELQLLEPVLTRIANDPATMNIARQRARHILQSSTATKLK